MKTQTINTSEDKSVVIKFNTRLTYLYSILSYLDNNEIGQLNICVNKINNLMEVVNKKRKEEVIN